MKLIDSYISRTQRETLDYKILQKLKYMLGKLLNFHNYLLAPGRLRKEIEKYSEPCLQLGSGSGSFGEASKHFITNYINTDIFGYYAIDATHKIGLPENSLTTIFSSHLIEHLYQKDIDRLLANSIHVLKPGGRFIVATPDLQKICSKLYSSKESVREEMLERHSRSLLGRKATPARILNCVMHINYGHKFALDFDTFEDLAFNAGFCNISAIEVDDIDDPHLTTYFANKPERYWVETSIWVAVKPETREK